MGVEGSGRGSTTYQAAAAAFVYDDHHGDVRVRRVIVVGLALVASLGFGQAEKRAHEPTHVAAGLATSTKFREKNRELLPGCSFAWTRTSESRLSRRLSALVWYWRERERLFRASNRARSRVRRLMEQTPEVFFWSFVAPAFWREAESSRSDGFGSSNRTTSVCGFSHDEARLKSTFI